MASLTPVCPKCGQHIIGIKHNYGGKLYCDACYQQLMAELEQLESQKVSLYSYIANLFGQVECPDFVIFGVEKALKSGKKIKGIEATIWWFYEVEGHPTNNIGGIIKVINEEYENAKKYISSQKKIKASNDLIDLKNIPTNNVTVVTTKNQKKWKPTYRMEDL